MIDSSGRRAIVSNGTILDMLAVGRIISLTGLLLVVIFTLVKPEASHGLGLMGRIVFWTLHVGLGLLAIWIASWWLGSRIRLPDSTLAAVLLSGTAGLVTATAGYMVLDVIYAPYIVDLDPDLPAASLLNSIGIEFIELAPWFMASWLIINLPVLLPQPKNDVHMNDGVLRDTSGTEQTLDLDKDDIQPRRTDEELPDATLKADSENSFLLNLPGMVGTDVIAVSSDLHYLNVWTAAGRTTVLGNLRDAVADLDERGMQVHRSHWVAHAHVTRIVGSASNAACILSNQLRIPVSRRRWKSVREHYGRGVVHRDTKT